ncbi:TonB-dependent receptor domain-containing protein [Paracoccus nototheniae]|uniref:TonB-dependent receptor domain-containing protein n=1 Tax=Paracoccus nototheniae TaxID=2489002 RepID=A0ABW4DWJ7_9RHOB|nr:TonB-dependent receptor [Paracoccus nototheniae]
MPANRMAALLLGTALFPTIALSQTVVLDPITLTSDSAQPGQIAASPEQIEDARTGSLEDVFRAEPSVSVSSGIAISERVFVNGVDETQLAVSVDGAAQNNRMFHHTGTNMIDPGLLKAARVDPGVAPADAGFGALAGSIAYETKSALDLLEDGRDFGGRATLGYTDNGKTATGALTLFGRQGPIDALVYAKRATGEAYDDGNGRTLPFTGADLNSYALKLGAEFGEWRAELGAISFQDESLRPYRPNFGGQSEPRLYAMDQQTQTLRLTRKAADGMFNPEIQLSRSDYQLDTQDLPRPDGRQAAFNNGDAETVTFTAKNTMTLGTTELSFGVDHQDSDARYDGLYYDRADIEQTFAIFSESRKNTGIFAQARGAQGAFDYSAGLRYDWNRFTGAGGQDLDSDGGSVNAAVTWHATDALSVNAGMSSVFGGTQLSSVYDMDFPLLEPDAYDALRPTRARNLLLGVEWTRGGTTLGAEAFRTTIGNLRKGLISRELESEGFRISARQDWQGGFAALRYSDTDVTLDGEGAGSYDLRDIGTIPGAMLVLEARHEIQTGLSVGGIVQHAIKEKHDGPDTDRDWPSYTVVDVFAEYEPAAYRNLTLRAEVNNLFDRAYADRATYGADYSSLDQQLEPGRSIAITADLRF